MEKDGGDEEEEEDYSVGMRRTFSGPRTHSLRSMRRSLRMQRPARARKRRRLANPNCRMRLTDYQIRKKTCRETPPFERDGAKARPELINILPLLTHLHLISHSTHIRQNGGGGINLAATSYS